MKMVSGLVAALVLLQLFSSSQVSWSLNLDMAANAFDDQYLCCADEMEPEMSMVLQQEKNLNKEFSEMWDRAQSHWEKKKQNLAIPDAFKDDYGVAVVLYTMEEPHPIYKQLNEQMSSAGQSRDFYMNHFHFKALHFYLTRALQVLRKGCTERFQVYRGTNLGNVIVSKQLRFGRFTSSSLSSDKAVGFGVNPFFNILTCFGVDINKLSDYEEEEILIPAGETFDNVAKSGNTYTVISTGQLCSYYNCAYLGGGKREQPLCHTEYTEDPDLCSSAPGLLLYSASRIALTLCGLTVFLTVIFMKLF